MLTSWKSETTLVYTTPSIFYLWNTPHSPLKILCHQQIKRSLIQWSRKTSKWIPCQFWNINFYFLLHFLEPSQNYFGWHLAASWSCHLQDPRFPSRYLFTLHPSNHLLDDTGLALGEYVSFIALCAASLTRHPQVNRRDNSKPARLLTAGHYRVLLSSRTTLGCGVVSSKEYSLQLRQPDPIGHGLPSNGPTWPCVLYRAQRHDDPSC